MDTPASNKRWDGKPASVQCEGSQAASQSAVAGTPTSGRPNEVSRHENSCIRPGICWDDTPWFPSNPRILLTDGQLGQAAAPASKAGLHGWAFPHPHGGRQSDACRFGIEALLAVMGGGGGAL